MTDRQHELLIEMVSKLNEAATYNRISAVLTFLWVFEVIYFIFWNHWDYMYSISLYFTIWLVCMIGWTHMNRKFRKCMDEYKKLREEYENLI